jgi:hypothetical protein
MGALSFKPFLNPFSIPSARHLALPQRCDRYRHRGKYQARLADVQRRGFGRISDQRLFSLTWSEELKCYEARKNTLRDKSNFPAVVEGLGVGERKKQISIYAESGVRKIENN